MKRRVLAAFIAIATTGLLLGCDEGGQGLGVDQQEQGTGGTTAGDTGSGIESKEPSDPSRYDGSSTNNRSNRGGAIQERSGETSGGSGTTDGQTGAPGSGDTGENTRDLTNKNPNAIGS